MAVYLCVTGYPYEDIEFCAQTYGIVSTDEFKLIDNFYKLYQFLQTDHTRHEDPVRNEYFSSIQIKGILDIQYTQKPADKETIKAFKRLFGSTLNNGEEIYRYINGIDFIEVALFQSKRLQFLSVLLSLNEQAFNDDLVSLIIEYYVYWNQVTYQTDILYEFKRKRVFDDYEFKLFNLQTLQNETMNIFNQLNLREPNRQDIDIINIINSYTGNRLIIDHLVDTS